MAISVTCDNCGKTLKAKEEWAGKRCKCSGCGGPVTVPQPQPKVELDDDSIALADDDPLGLAGDDPFDDAAGSGGHRSGRRCPGCSAAMADNAVICIQCGHDTRSGKSVKKVAKRGGSGSRDLKSFIASPQGKIAAGAGGAVLLLLVLVLVAVSRSGGGDPYVAAVDDPNPAAAKQANGDASAADTKRTSAGDAPAAAGLPQPGEYWVRLETLWGDDEFKYDEEIVTDEPLVRVARDGDRVTIDFAEQHFSGGPAELAQLKLEAPLLQSSEAFGRLHAAQALEEATLTLSWKQGALALAVHDHRNWVAPQTGSVSWRVGQTQPELDIPAGARTNRETFFKSGRPDRYVINWRHPGRPGFAGMVARLVSAPPGSLPEGTIVTGEPLAPGELRRYEGHTGQLNSLELSRDGSLCLSCDADGNLFAWRTADGGSAQPLRLPEMARRDGFVELMPDESRVLSAAGLGNTAHLHIWPLSDPQEFGEPFNLKFEFPEQPQAKQYQTAWTLNFHRLALSDDGRRAITETHVGRPMLTLWDVEARKPLFTRETSAPRLAISPRGQFAVFGGAIHKLDAGQPIAELDESQGAVAFSPAEDAVAVAEDRLVVVYALAAEVEAEDGQEAAAEGKENPGALRRRAVCIGHEAEVADVAYLPEGGRVASLARDGTLRLWDATTGRELRRFHCQDEAAGDASTEPGPTGSGPLGRARRLHLAVSGNGQVAATAGPAGTIRLWDLRTDAPETEPTPSVTLTASKLDPPAEGLKLLAVSPDGQYAVFDGRPEFEGSPLQLWTTDPMKPLRGFPHPDNPRDHLGRLRRGAVVFSPDSKYLVTVEERKAWRWSIRGKKPVGTLETDPFRPNQAWFTPDGEYLLVSGWNQPGMLIADAGKLEVEHVLTGAVNGYVVFSPDGKRFAVPVKDGGDGTAIVEMETWRIVAKTRWLDQVVFSPNGRYLVGLNQGVVVVVDAVSGQTVRQLEPPEGDFFTNLALSGDGSLIACATPQAEFALFDLQSGRQLQRLRVLPSGLIGRRSDALASLEFGEQGRSIVAGLAGVLDYQRSSLHLQWPSAEALRGPVPEGGAAGAANPAGGGRTLDYVEHAHLAEDWNNVRGIAFSPDGTLLAATSARYVEDRDPQRFAQLEVWQSDSGKVVATIQRDEPAFKNLLEFSGDGRRLITDSPDNKLTVWDLAAEKELCRLEGHPRGKMAAALSSDGRRALTGAAHFQEKSVRLWDAESGELLAELARPDGQTFQTIAVAFSADDTQCFAATSQECLAWDRESGSFLEKKEFPGNLASLVELGPHGKTALVRNRKPRSPGSTFFDTFFRFVDLAGGQPVTLQVPDAQEGRGSSPGPFVLSTDGTRAVRRENLPTKFAVYDLASGRIVAAGSATGRGTLGPMAVSKAAHYVAVVPVVNANVGEIEGIRVFGPAGNVDLAGQDAGDPAGGNK